MRAGQRITEATRGPRPRGLESIHAREKGTGARFKSLFHNKLKHHQVTGLQGTSRLESRSRARWLLGKLTGAAMSLIVDEGMTPLFGFSAPNRDYPLSTHPRGFATHLAFGLGVAATAETVRWLGSNGRRKQDGLNDARR